MPALSQFAVNPNLTDIYCVGAIHILKISPHVILRVMIDLQF